MQLSRRAMLALTGSVVALPALPAFAQTKS
jgi:hypothetical protein